MKINKLITTLLIASFIFLLNACFKEKTVTISFDSNGGSIVEPIVTNGETIVLPLNPDKVGYTFAGWYFDNGTFLDIFDENIELTIETSYQTTVYAKWSPNSYSISYELDGGVNADNNPVEFVYDSSEPEIGVPTKEGYIFAGWYLDGNYSDRLVNLTTIADNVTLYVKWIANAYEITYELDGGTNNFNNPTNFIFEEELPVIYNPIKEGYSFDGWYFDSSFETSLTNLTSNAYNIKLYAKWSPKTYSISYEMNGGINDQLNPTQFIFDSEYPIIHNPTREGHTFMGWYLDADFEEILSNITTNSKDIVLHAKWEINVYKITYLDWDNNSLYIYEYEYNSYLAFIEGAIPVREGYTFKEWDIELPETMPAMDLVLNAIYQVNSYEISFESNEGDFIEKLSLNYDTQLQLPKPNKEGYDFSGWYLDEMLSDVFELDKMPANNLLLYAKWENATFKLIFFDYNDEIIREDEISYMTDLSNYIKPVISRMGYYFTGWSKSLPNSMPAADYEVKATYTVNQYRINYDTVGGNTIFSEVYDFGEVLIEPQAPIKEGHTFMGWFLDEQNQKPFVFTTMPAKNLILYAKWDNYIELYPYDDINCLLENDLCDETKLGDSSWDFIYANYRYHIVRGSVRFASRFYDENNDGYLSEYEITGTSWSAFASMILNDTTNEITISTSNRRANITQITHRMWAYFDSNGRLQMFEDHVSTYHIINDGSVLYPDWRLANQEEMDFYDQATEGAKPLNMRKTYIRLAIDESDFDGYRLEPLKYLYWTNEDVDVLKETNVEKWSTIVKGNPDYVTIPSGWTVISFGTNDRGNNNLKTLNFIKQLPYLMTDAMTEPLKVEYVETVPEIEGIYDQSHTHPGIDLIIPIGGSFDMYQQVNSTWINMFDENGHVINKKMNLNYTVSVYDSDVFLESVIYEYINNSYTRLTPFTSIDAAQIGKKYKLVFESVAPTGVVTQVITNLHIGEIAPIIGGVRNRYVSTSSTIDLLEGITVLDQSGRDLSSYLNVTAPQTFDINNLESGIYKIIIELNYPLIINNMSYTIRDSKNYNLIVDNSVYQFDLNAPYFLGIKDMFFNRSKVEAIFEDILAYNGSGEQICTGIKLDIPEGFDVNNPEVGAFDFTITIEIPKTLILVDSLINISGTIKPFNTETSYNNDRDVISYGGTYAIWDDLTHFRDSKSEWGSVFVVIGSEGKVQEIFSRYDSTYVSKTVTKTTDYDFDSWQSNLELEEDGFVLTAHGPTYATILRHPTLNIGDTISFTILDTVEYLLSVSETFTVTITE